MYQGLEAKLHDVFWDAEAPGVELELIKFFLREREGKSLEIGCGSGRIMLPLLEAGFDVAGSDISIDMLELLKKELSDREVEIHRGDVLDIDVSEFRNFLLPAFTFMLFEEGRVASTLRYLATQAGKGAGLYFTIFMPWAEICGELEEEEWYEDHSVEKGDGSYAKCDTRFNIDRTHQRLMREHRYSCLEPGGELQEYSSQQKLRWYTYMEIVELLRGNGWELNRCIFDLDLEADSENAHLYTFEATAR